MPVRLVRAVCVLAALAGVAGALLLPWLPTATAVSHFVIEDCAYYLTAARHVLAGHGATLDGVNPTNGFHPLWLLMVCGVEAVFGTTGALPLHATLTLAAVGFIAIGALLCWRIREEGGAWLVAPFAAVFFFNYRLMAVPLGGLETAVAGLAVVAVAAAASQWSAALDARRAAGLGILIGLACWARMDAFLLGGIVLAWLAYRGWRDKGIRQVSFVFLAGVTALVSLTPWFVWSWSTVHHLLPRSGEALALWSASPWQQPWTHDGVMRAARVTLIGPAGNIANLIGVWPLVNTAGAARLTGAAALLAVIAALGALAWRARHDDRVQRVAWMPIFAGCLWAYYTRTDREHIRYLYPVVLLLFYFAAVVLGAASRASARPGRWTNGVYVAVPIMLVFLAAAGLSAYRQGFASGYTHPMHGAIYEDVVPWLQRRTPPSTVVGAFNAGMISYFSDRRTVDLDAVMDDNAIAALREQRLCDYIERQGISYLADNDQAIAFFLDRDASCKAAAWRTRWRVVHQVTWPPDAEQNALDWVVLERVTPGRSPQ